MIEIMSEILAIKILTNNEFVKTEELKTARQCSKVKP